MGAGRRRLKAEPLWPSVHQMSHPTTDGCHWQVKVGEGFGGHEGAASDVGK